MATIVFVEDDPVIQKLIRAAMRRTSHEVYLASDGLEGLEVIERRRPDLVFSDVSMPGLDGMQLLARMKASPALAGIPVVFVTASVQRHQMEEGYRLGVTGYLPKPFDVASLRAKVEALLQAPR